METPHCVFSGLFDDEDDDEEDAAAGGIFRGIFRALFGLTISTSSSSSSGPSSESYMRWACTGFFFATIARKGAGAGADDDDDEDDDDDDEDDDDDDDDDEDDAIMSACGGSVDDCMAFMFSFRNEMSFLFYCASSLRCAQGDDP